MTPEITILADWPSAMDAKTASAYLSVSPEQFRKLADEHPDFLRAFNFMPKGDKRYSREGLDAFRQMREAGGMEREKAV